MKLEILLVAPAVISLSGCATIMNGSTQAVNITTEPPGAICDVKYKNPPTITSYYMQDRKEWVLSYLDTAPLASIVAPGIVVLNRNIDYSVYCNLSGYKETVGEINHHLVDYVYFTLGNIFCCGIIPGLIADSMTGAAHHLAPTILNMQMIAPMPSDLPGYVAPHPTGPVKK